MRNRLLLILGLMGGIGLPISGFTADNALLLEPHPVMVAPFVILLLAIALMPFIHKHHWENHYPKVSIGLGAITVVYYLFVLHNGQRMLTSMIEYCGFIALIGSLFVIAGGIHIDMSGKATPGTNVGLLAMGAILANLIGTTGASMLLIRPFLRINKYRIAAYHVVFFIFIVSNVGGALTPIGDPPLFLGYLKGVPFFWLLGRPRVVLSWLLTCAVLLGLFYVIDALEFRKYKTEVKRSAEDRVLVEGNHNFIWLFIIIGLVLVQKAEFLKTLEHTQLVEAMSDVFGWGPQKTFESCMTVVIAVLMTSVACLAYKFATKEALRENEFTFAPIKEVGFLFVGIFATMVPALDLLEKHAGDLGIRTLQQFFWGTGALSSVLDNAPTYLNFLTAAFGLKGLSLENPTDVATFLSHPQMAVYLASVSISAVYFGAMTYIGNGPNFMVKSIAESSGVKCPSFFGYIVKYSVPILLPIFALLAWMFLR
jgi:Na+/H+ antiporter NhaD/arsenite permease-like protein